MENRNQMYHIHITSTHKWYELKLKEVWQYRDLIWLFTKRNFALRYKQTVLGPAWLFLTPIISSFIYAFVFGGIAGIGTDGIPQMLFYLSGTALWSFFAGCITRNASTFTSNAGVFGKVYFPRLTVPISNMLTSVLEYGIQFLLILAFLVFYLFKGDVQPNYVFWLLIPLILLHLGTMGLGVGIVISSLTTKYRDLSIIVGFGVQLWMYVTPVVYPLSEADGGFFRIVLLINPVTAPVELYRYALLGKGEFLPYSMIWSIVFTILVLLFGVVVFNKVEKTFMDTV